jgi:hypothetical protein
MLHLYSAHPILLSRSCKHETANDHTTLLQAVVDAINNKQDMTGLRVISLASDRESHHGKALTNLTYVVPLAPSSLIYNHLAHLDLMDYFVSPNDITVDKDYKHIFKCLCNALLHNNGCLVYGVCLTCAVICKHFKDSRFTDAHISYVLNPTDKQDVVLAYALLKDLWTLLLADPDSSTPTYIKAWESLHIYGKLSCQLVFLYICPELSLSEQLEYLSAAVHLVLVLYILDGTRSAFIPGPLFVDISIMVKNTFFCIAKVKVDHPNGPFFLVLLGTNQLESLFGILCTMIGNNTNLDMLQLSLHITSTTEVSSILAKYPAWDKGPYRLHLSIVSRDFDKLTNSVDHIGPKAYLSPEKLYPSGLMLATLWKHGQHFIENKYSWVMPVLQSISSTQNASILTPYRINLMTCSLLCRVNDTDMKEDVEEDTPSYKKGSTSEALDAITGMQELEDAIAESKWRNSEAYGQGSHSHLVQIRGMESRSPMPSPSSSNMQHL